jgi:hypothetical protein
VTLTHSVIASMRDERDVEVPTIAVPVLDTWVIEDGDDHLAEHIRTEHTQCFCQDGHHRNEDRRDLSPYRHTLLTGAHHITAHMYAVITEEPA